MVKKTITYKNLFTDEQVSEEHYFHISKADLVEMQMEEYGAKYTTKDGREVTGMEAYLLRISEAEDAAEAYKWIKEILRRAYLRREGDRPIKNPEIWAEFEDSEAYSQLIWELFTDQDELSTFITAVFPSNLEGLAAEVQARVQENAQRQGAGSPIAAVPDPVEPRTLTREELTTMDQTDLQAGLAAGRYKLS